MSSIKPITLYSHASGPNPWKVVIILEELSIPYKTEFMDFALLHKPEFEKINPNGRVPAIHDPNTNITLWESGAIIEYLIDTYDKKSTLTYTSSPEKYLVKQYLFFQVSGQGPYFGQAAWFGKFHHEKLESAITRYQNEALRIVGVLENALKGKKYLVGDKCTYADLSFVTWNVNLAGISGPDFNQKEFDAKYPNFSAWHNSLITRPAVKKALADKAAAMSGGH